MVFSQDFINYIFSEAIDYAESYLPVKITSKGVELDGDLLTQQQISRAEKVLKSINDILRVSSFRKPQQLGAQ